MASGTVLFETDSSFTNDIQCTQLVMPIGRVHGTVYLDDDHSCAPDPGEARIPGQIMEVLPGPVYGVTDANGVFDLPLPNGSYTARVVSNGMTPICPAMSYAPFTVTDAFPFPEVLIGDSSTTKLDIVAAASFGPARRGFPVAQTIQFANASAYPSGPITATEQLDPLLSYIDASIVPVSVVGNTITWSLPALAPFTQHSIVVHGQVPADVGLIGQAISITVQAFQTLEETVLYNNTYSVRTVITGSSDPNDKVAWPRDVYDLTTDSALDYTIHFQNTGTDTAFSIVITDTLAAELDMATFQQGAASHPYALSFKPERVVEWHFNNIQLPDSNVNEPSSHGLVSFRIRPGQPTTVGTTFRNKAAIYFDFNPPVITEPSVVVAELNTLVTHMRARPIGLWPNPANTSVTVTSSSAVAPVVHDMSGRAVHLPFERHNGNVTIDVRDLPNGIYAVRTAEGTARFVKR